MEDFEPTPQQRAALINASFRQTTQLQTGASPYYIIWGLVLVFYFTSQFLSLHFRTAWLANAAELSHGLFMIGGLFSFLQKRNDERTEIVVPIHEKLFEFSWIGASMCLVVLCLCNVAQLPVFLCLGVLLIFGLVNFIIGGVTRYLPLTIGGATSALLALLVFRLTIDYAFLITAVGVFCSCLLPGLLMKKQNA
jgi:hypothetical protein